MLHLALLLFALPLTGDSPALTGLDPVHLCEGREVEGQADLTKTFGRYTYQFADPETRERFLADPERWAIQWGGGCGRMGPLSGRGSPDRWTVHDGRIWIFASDGCRNGFLEAPEKFAVTPEPSPEPTAEQLARGREWVERAVQAHGGEAVDAMRSVRMTSVSERDGWTHEVTLEFDVEGRVRRRSQWIPEDVTATSYDTLWVVADEAFTDEDGTIHPLAAAAERQDLRRYAHREPLYLLRARKRSDFRAVALGESTFDGTPSQDVWLELDGLVTVLHLHPDKAIVRGLSWTGRASDGLTADIVETFEPWNASIRFSRRRRAAP